MGGEQMKHKVSELEGELLDAAVAIAEGRPYRLYSVSFDNRFSKVQCMVARGGHPESIRRMSDYDVMFEPSSPWRLGPSQALEIIEREHIEWEYLHDEPEAVKYCAFVRDFTKPIYGQKDAYMEIARARGPTARAASMRAFVASRLGAEVEIADVSVPEKYPFWKRLEAEE